jgi:hypothetical protein
VRFEDGRRKITAVDSAHTDDMGQYRITGLAPGKYYLRADPQTKGPGMTIIAGDLGFITEGRDVSVFIPSPHQQQQVLLPALFPGVQDPQSARTVDVEAGARVTGIDISLPRSATVTVKGHVTVPEGARAGIVGLSRGQWMANGLDPRLITNVDEHGDFTFAAVPQGSYIATATATVTRPHKVQMQVNNVPAAIEVVEGVDRSYEGKVPVDVRNTPVDGVQVVVSAAAEVTGRVVLAGGDGPMLTGSIEFDDGVSEIRRADLSQGEFNLDLPQGRYNIYLNLNPTDQSGPLLLRSAKWAGRDVLAESLIVSGPGKISLDLVAAPDGAKLEGAVLDKDDKPAAGFTVVLIPESKFRLRADRYFQTETDQYGRFNFDGIPPGDYKAYAWDDIEPGIWFDPDFVKSIESNGEKVTLKTGAVETTRLHLQ